MDLGLLWFVLAGFILGFAASTLWEWLYFRRLRVRTPVQPASDLYMLVDDGGQRPATTVAEYRSPGVFLESEQPTPAVPLTPRQPAIHAASESVPADYELHPTHPDAASRRSGSAGDQPSA